MARVKLAATLLVLVSARSVTHAKMTIRPRDRIGIQPTCTREQQHQVEKIGKARDTSTSRGFIEIWIQTIGCRVVHAVLKIGDILLHKGKRSETG